jgi:chromate transport protein ChrA
MALPSAVRALRILLYVLMAFVAIAVVGIALQYYPGSVFVQVLSLLPAVASVVQVFYLQQGRGVLRITLTVTLSVYVVGAFCAMVMERSPGAVIGVVLGTAMLVLLHQRSSREWFTPDPPA